MMKAKTKRMILIIIQCALIAICISYFKLSNEIVNVRYSEKGGHYFYSDGTVEDAPNIYYYKEFDNYFAVYHGKQLTYYAVSPGYTKDSRYVILQTTRWNQLFGRNTTKIIPITHTYTEVPKVKTVFMYNGDATPQELNENFRLMNEDTMVALNQFTDGTVATSK
ncbi:MAG: hypothetical protein VZT48_13220 [Bulleidia sp.]|nr:hypothetical protein [Bulleidia sp.]